MVQSVCVDILLTICAAPAHACDPSAEQGGRIVLCVYAYVLYRIPMSFNCAHEFLCLYFQTVHCKAT